MTYFGHQWIRQHTFSAFVFKFPVEIRKNRVEFTIWAYLFLWFHSISGQNQYLRCSAPKINKETRRYHRYHFIAIPPKMVKVQNVGAVVGWIISIVWTIFLVVIITNYAHKSAFVRIIHTVLSPFHDVDMETCKYIAISICGESHFVCYFRGSEEKAGGDRFWNSILDSFLLVFSFHCLLSNPMRYFSCIISASNIFATQAWRYGIQNVSHHMEK